MGEKTNTANKAKKTIIAASPPTIDSIDAIIMPIKYVKTAMQLTAADFKNLPESAVFAVFFITELGANIKTLPLNGKIYNPYLYDNRSILQKYYRIFNFAYAAISFFVPALSNAISSNVSLPIGDTATIIPLPKVLWQTR